jgi:hypothetical protein
MYRKLSLQKKKHKPFVNGLLAKIISKIAKKKFKNPLLIGFYQKIVSKTSKKFATLFANDFY